MAALHIAAIEIQAATGRSQPYTDIGVEMLLYCCSCISRHGLATKSDGSNAKLDPVIFESRARLESEGLEGGFSLMETELSKNL